MVERNDPIALILVAHWAVLIERADSCGCWFLKGCAKRVREFVEEKLAGEELPVRELLNGLEGVG